MAQSDEHDDKDAELTTVFFSYSRVDQAQALPIIDAIEAAGYRVWWDGMLEGGTSFLETTEEALESAKAVVVLWSKTSISSHWVRDEATSGRVRERLIPLTLDGTIAPLGFRQVQLIDIQKWDGDDTSSSIQELVRMLAVMHGGNVPKRRAVHSKPKAVLSRRHVMMAGASAVVAIGGGLSITSGLFAKGANLLENGVAVLPFRNASGDSAQDYLSAGLSSELRISLARNQALQVVSRSSSEALASQSLTAKDIAKRLGVAHILDGNVSREGADMRVTAELINGKTGFNVWGKTFQHTENETLKIHNLIAEAITGVLTQKVSQTNIAAETAETENPAAFTEYLKGTDLFRSNISRTSNLVALEHLDRAVNLDPSFSRAHAAKARLLLWLGATSSDQETVSSYFAAALNSANLAVRQSPNSAIAQSSLAYVKFAQLDIKGAKVPYEKSRELGFGSATILARYATYKAVTGQQTEAISSINRAKTLDPLNPTIHRTDGTILYFSRRYEASIKATQHALNLSPKHTNAKSQIGNALIALGRFEEATNVCEDEKNQMERLPCLAIAFNKLGRTDQAKAAQKQLIDTFGDAGAYQQVQILSQWGEVDLAVKMMEKAIKLNDSGLILAKVDPALDPLRSKTEFSDMLAALGFSD